MYGIVPWIGEAIAVVLAILILVFVTLLCVTRSRSSSRLQGTNALNFNSLCGELKTVTDWHQLGINLGVPADELRKIERDYQGNDRRRAEMLDLWLQRTPNATWKDVVDALQQMGENAVAEKIREKYIRGRSPSSPVDSGAVEIAHRNKQTIDLKFATLLKNLCNKLAGRKINMKDLRVFLKTFSPGECIPESSDIHDIFEALSSNKLWDSWNYFPLKKLVEEFAADDQEIASWIEAYREDLKSYKVSTRLIDRISVAESDSTVDEPEEQEHDKPARYDKQYYQTLSFKLKSRFTDQTMQYIDGLWDEIGDLYNLPHYVILLDSVRKGCVSIVWRIPSYIATKILEAPPPSDEFYHKHGITRVEYGGEGIYQEGEFAVSGPGLKSATTNQVSKFTVHTYDTHRQPPHFQQHVSAELKSLVDGSVLQATVVSQTPSTYELSYIPTTRGRHQLTVRVNDTEIETFQVFVQHPPTQFASGPGLTSAITNQVSKFTVRTSDTHGQSTSVTAELKSLVNGSVLQATVVSQAPSTYELSYTPTTRGRHQLTVQVNNTEIGTFQVFVQYPPTQLGTPVRIIEGLKPHNIAVGDKGELFVTDIWNHYTVLDSQGQKLLTIGSKGKPPFGDRSPDGITTDGAGNVYVANGDKVQKFNRQGDVIKSVGKRWGNIGEFNGAWGIMYYNHQVYVCDRDNSRVQVFDSDLNFVRSFGYRVGPGQLKKPRDIDFDAQGNIYVVDFRQHEVLVFGDNGQYLYQFGEGEQGKGELTEPQGLCVSGDYVYVTERCNHRVSVFRTSGKFVHSFGRGELKSPCGIAVDQDGFVLVCDSSNECIQVF